MNSSNNQQFNDRIRERTLKMSIDVQALVCSKKTQLSTRPMVQQILRSSSSIAANFRSATRARSDAEYYSKICIVVEECDETQFWLEYLLGIRFLENEESFKIRDEVDQLLRLFASIKSTMKNKLHK